MRRLGQKTIWERNWLTSSTPDSTEPKQHAESFVWATSEKTRPRALSLYLIHSIVERHGGTIDIDLATDMISIDVPKKEEVPCALEIEEQVGNLCW
jgi:sensor histidine kinase regulating citrate/malate metabolism